VRADTIPLRPETICLACGVTLSPALERPASLRCHDCRDCGSPIRPELVASSPPQLRRQVTLPAAA